MSKAKEIKKEISFENAKLINVWKPTLRVAWGKLGFDFDGLFITDPFISPCETESVDPKWYYGLTTAQVKQFKDMGYY
jgi:hypothetical protein